MRDKRVQKQLVFRDAASLRGFTIAPNPANNSADIILDKEAVKTDKELTIQQIEITNKSGIVIRRFKYTGTKQRVTLDISALSPDVYYLRLYDGKEWKTEILSKQ